MGIRDFLRWPKASANTGGFEGASYARRLKGFVATRQHINALMASAGPTLTSRARYLVRNGGYAFNAVNSWGSAIAGFGIKPVLHLENSRLKEQIHNVWKHWTDEADADGLTDLYGLQRRGARESFIAGEVFFRIRRRYPEDGLTVPLQLQMLPSEMLPFEKSEVLSNGRIVRQGVEFNQIGQRTAYSFYRNHPGDSSVIGSNNQAILTSVPASEVLHVYDPIDGMQIRGTTMFAPAIVKLFMLDLYNDAELSRKNVAALFAAFITPPFDEANSSLEEGVIDDEGIYPLEPGQIRKLKPGEGVQFSSPADVGGTYEAFQYRTLLEIAAALGLPYSCLTGDVLRANYSNVRASLVEFKRKVEAFQNSVMIYQFCRPIWRAFFEAAIMSGAIDVSISDYRKNKGTFLNVEWMTPHIDWVDPLKDGQADILMMKNGLKPREMIAAERGYNIEEIDAMYAKDQARQAALGLRFDDSNVQLVINSDAPKGEDKNNE